MFLYTGCKSEVCEAVKICLFLCKFCLEIEFCVKVLRIFCVEEEFQAEFESYVSLFITMVSHEDNL